MNILKPKPNDMGIYPVDCIVCKKPFLWWSGNIAQICSKCEAVKEFKHKMYEVKYSGICIQNMPSSKKGGHGWWRIIGNRYSDTDIVPMTFAEPTDEIFMKAVQLTNPHLLIDKVEWNLINENSINEL